MYVLWSTRLSAVVWFGSSPPPLLPLSHQQVVFLRILPVCRRRGRGVGRGAKQYDGKKAWYSILKTPCLQLPRSSGTPLECRVRLRTWTLPNIRADDLRICWWAMWGMTKKILVTTLRREYFHKEASKQIVLNDHRGPDFLALVWFGSSLTHSQNFLPSVYKLDRRHKETTQWQERGVEEEPIHTAARKPGIRKTFNNLWCTPILSPCHLQIIQ